MYPSIVKQSLTCFVLFFALISTSIPLQGQSSVDSTRFQKVMKRLRPQVDISFRNRWMSPFIYQFNKNYNPFSDPPRVNVHPFLLDYREEAYNTNAYEPELVQDNPVFHNSLQTILHSRWHIAKGVNVDANLLLEQQGHSFGIYNSARTFISPQVRLEIDRDLRFFKQDFNFRGAVGTFRDFRLNEGLILYNYDLQGLIEAEKAPVPLRADQ